PSVVPAHASENLGDVQHQGLGVATAAQPPLDVEHAAEIAKHHRIGPAGGNLLTLVVRKPGRDLAELDRERATEAAAVFALGHLGELQAPDPREQRSGLLLDAHLAQAGAA